MFGGRCVFFSGPIFVGLDSTWSGDEYSYEFGSFGRPGGRGGTHGGGSLSDSGVLLRGSFATPVGTEGTRGGVLGKLLIFGVLSPLSNGWF